MVSIWRSWRSLGKVRDRRGLEGVPMRAPLVFAPNHRSLLDAFVIAAVLPLPRLRQTFWGGATEWLFTTPFARWLSRLANVVPVDPRRAAISSLALGAAVLQRNQNLVWFPEGGRSRTGELQRFLPGVGKLLERFKVPVVPVFIQGTERALPAATAVSRSCADVPMIMERGGAESVDAARVSWCVGLVEAPVADRDTTRGQARPGGTTGRAAA